MIGHTNRQTNIDYYFIYKDRFIIGAILRLLNSQIELQITIVSRQNPLNRSTEKMYAKTFLNKGFIDII